MRRDFDGLWRVDYSRWGCHIFTCRAVYGGLYALLSGEFAARFRRDAAPSNAGVLKANQNTLAILLTAVNIFPNRRGQIIRLLYDAPIQRLYAYRVLPSSTTRGFRC